MANWTTINSGGGSIAVPSAPNVLGTTSVTVLYSCPGNDSLYQLQASIAIDTGNTNIGHLKQIHVANSLSAQEVAVILRPSGGWTTPVVVTSDPMAQTGADQPGTLTFICCNDISDQTAGALTKSFTVQASKVNSITSQMEVVGSRVADVNRVVYFTASFVPVLNGNQVPQNVSYCFSADGTNWTYVGWTKILQVGQAVTISRPVPATQQTTWKFAAKTGAVQWIGGTNYSTQNLTDNGFLIAGSPFTVNGLATPASNLVTGMSVGTITAKGPDPTTGWQWAEFNGINWTDPPVTAAGAEAWLVKYYVRETNISGTPTGDDKGTWREVDEFQIIYPGGQARTSIGKPPLQITYRKPTDPYVAYHYLQVQIVVANRNSTKPTDWAGADTTNSVAQTGGFFQLDIGTLPTGKIPLNMADPATVLPGTQVTDVPAPPAGAGFALALTIVAGPSMATAQEVYGWTGTVTPPTNRANYYGCVLTQQWQGKNEGGAFCTLPADGANPVSFNSDNYYPRSSTAAYCTFRAYPISRDGVRGTPVIANGGQTTIPASGAYVPPSGPAPVGNMTISSAVAYDTSVPSAPTITVSGSVGSGAVTNYAGCDLTLLWDGQSTEIPGGHLDAATTTYRFPAWPQKGTTDGVVVKCYPTNSNGVRGTGISAAHLAIAAGSYPNTPAPSSTGMTIWAGVTKGPLNNAGVPTFGWSGLITLPTDLTNYNGCHLTQQWPGANEIDVGDLVGATTTFSNGYWPWPGASASVTLRVYPVSRDGQRGTPASFVLTIPASVSYTPPTAGQPLTTLDFEDGTFGDWTFTGIGNWGIDAASPISGIKSGKATPGASDQYLYRDVYCTPGATFSAQFKYKSSSGATSAALVFGINFFDAAYSIDDYHNTFLNPSTSPVTVTIGPYVVPAGAVIVRIALTISGGTAGTRRVDDISLASSGGTGVILHPLTGLPASFKPESDSFHSS